MNIIITVLAATSIVRYKIVDIFKVKTNNNNNKFV